MVDLAVTDDGPRDGDVVVLGGSLGSTRAMWEPQVQPLTAAGLRVVRYDTRGHGESPVPPGPYDIDDLVDDLVALLDRLGVARAHLVGLSLGGMVALRTAIREPHRVDRLVAMCTSAQLGPPSAWAERIAAVRAHGLGSVAPGIVSRWFTAARQADDQEIVAWAEQMLASTPLEGYVGCCAAIQRMDLRDQLGSITAPLLAIAGDQDLATPVPHLQAIADGVPRGRLAVVEQAAHLANVEQPAAVNALLIEHLCGPTEGPADHPGG